MKGKWLVVLILLALVACALVACTPDGTQTPAGQDNQIEVTNGTAAVFAAMKQSCSLSGDIEAFYLAFDLRREKEGDYDVLYRFAALLNVSEQGIQQDSSQLSFVVETDIKKTKQFEAYYTDATLYVNHPLVPNAAFSSLNLSALAEALRVDLNEGELHTLGDLLPALGNRIFDECTVSVEGNKSTYRFRLNFAALCEAAGAIAEAVGHGLEAEDVLGLLGTSADLPSCYVSFTLEQKLGVNYFVSASMSEAEGGLLHMERWVSTVVSEANRDTCTVEVADSLSAFRPYHPANLDIAGTLSLDLASVKDLPVGLLGESWIANLNKQVYRWDYMLKSCYTADGWVADALLVQGDKNVRLHYAKQILYADLNAFGLGKLRVELPALDAAVAALGMGDENPNLSRDEWAELLLDLVCDRKVEGDISTYTLDKKTVQSILSAVVYALSGEGLAVEDILGADGLQLVVDTSMGKIKALQMDLMLWGGRLSVVADRRIEGSTVNTAGPLVGPQVVVPEGDWLEECVSREERARLTLTAEGRLRSDTLLDGNGELIEALVESLSGEKLDLVEMDHYRLSVSTTPKGALQVVWWQLLDGEQEVCSLYYHAGTPNRFYVILPEDGEADRVLSLGILEGRPFDDFMRAVNGNTPPEDAELRSLTNSADGFALTWSLQGVRGLLSRIGAVLPDWDVRLPEGFVPETVRLTTGEGAALRFTFGGSTFVELGINSLTLDDRSVEWQNATLPTREISLFAPCDLPDELNLVLGEEGKEVRLSLEENNLAWHFGSTPSVGEGRVAVLASVQVLGQNVTCLLNTDTTAPLSMKVVGADEARAFTFARYNSDVDPVEEILKSNVAAATFDGYTRNLHLNWLYQGLPLEDAVFAGTGSSFSLTPAVESYFGTLLPLPETFTLTLEGAAAVEVENKNNYLTLAAYDGRDPFAVETYGTPVLTLEDGSKLVPQSFAWKTDSVRNATVKQNGKLLDAAALVALLENNLYMADGQYVVAVAVADSLGREQRFDVMVEVEPRVIERLAFLPEALGEGTAFANGVFSVEPLVLDSIATGHAFADSAVCYFVGVDGATQMSTLSWNVQAVESVSFLLGASADFTVTVGDEIGGRQTVSLRYEVKPLEAVSVALLGEKEGALVAMSEPLALSAEGKEYTLSLVGEKALHPYDFATPCGLRFALEGDEVLDVELALFDSLPERLWNDSEKIYEHSLVLSGVQFKLQLSFLKKVVESWQLVALHYTYKVDAEGEWIRNGESYLPYDAAEHVGQTRYVRIPCVNEVDGYHVYYKTTVAGSFVVLDPNRVDFRKAEAYPQTVLVHFADGEEREVKLVWDLSALQDASADEGFVGQVQVALPLGQALGTVGVRVDSARPARVFTQVSVDGEGNALRDEFGNIVAGQESLSLTLLTVNTDGTVLAHDPDDVATLHRLLCGEDCEAVDCLGKLYFDYALGTENESGFFAIDEWRYLERIGALYAAQMAQGVPVEQVSGIVEIVAVVGHVEYIIPLNIQRVVLSNRQLCAIPYAGSSMGSAGGQVESMTTATDGEGRPTLRIDPYVANPLVASFYPTRIRFDMLGKEVLTPIDGWDLSALADMVPYMGGEGVVYALLHTPMGDCRIAVPVEVVARRIETVYVDGSASRSVYIDGYAASPFGQSREEKEGRTYAYRRVEVQFRGDDLLYTMLMRYDITDMRLSFAGGMLAENVSVEVGSEAGGWQRIDGYNFYAKPNVLLRVEESERVWFDAELGINTFAEAGEDAWRYLTTTAERITVVCGEIGAGTSYVASVSGAGLHFSWTRSASGEMRFVLENRDAIFADKMGEAQTLATGTKRTMELAADMLILKDLEEGLVRQYVAGYTVADFLKDYPVRSVDSRLFADSDLSVCVLQNGEELGKDSALTVGAYVLRVSLPEGHLNCSGYLDLSFEIAPQPIALSLVSVRHINRVYDLEALMASGLSMIYNGQSLLLSTTVAQDGLSLVMEYAQGGVAMDTPPVEVGVYTLTLHSADPNYVLAAPVVITIEITEQ